MHASLKLGHALVVVARTFDALETARCQMLRLLDCFASLRPCIGGSGC